MINAIVLNTLTGAVSEYEDFAFQSITPTHMGSATGLFLRGGDLDAAMPIVSNILTGKTRWGTSLKHYIGMVFLLMRGSGTSALIVAGESATHTYAFPVQPNGASRTRPGRGIRENYLAFGYTNLGGGADFQLDAIEIEFENKTSTNRRT